MRLTTIPAIDGGLDNPQGLKEHSNAGPFLKGIFYAQVIVLWSEGAVLDVILCCSLNPCAMLRPLQPYQCIEYSFKKTKGNNAKLS